MLADASQAVDAIAGGVSSNPETEGEGDGVFITAVKAEGSSEVVDPKQPRQAVKDASVDEAELMDVNAWSAFLDTPIDVEMEDTLWTKKKVRPAHGERKWSLRGGTLLTRVCVWCVVCGVWPKQTKTWSSKDERRRQYALAHIATSPLASARTTSLVPQPPRNRRESARPRHREPRSGSSGAVGGGMSHPGTTGDEANMPKNVERLLQLKLARLRTNPAVRHALNVRVQKARKARKEDILRRSHGTNIVLRHVAQATGGYFAKSEALQRLQERSRLRDARSRRNTTLRVQRGEQRALLRMRRRREAINEAKRIAAQQRRRVCMWAVAIKTHAAHELWLQRAKPTLDQWAGHRARQQAATTLQLFFRGMRSKTFEVARIIAVLRIQRMLRAVVWYRRFRRADPRRDAQATLVQFLTDCGNSSMALVIRDFRKKVMMAQRVWRDYKAATASRLHSLSLRFDEVEREQRDRARKRRQRAQDKRGYAALLELATGETSVGEGGEAPHVLPKVPTKVKAGVKKAALFVALKAARWHFVCCVVPVLKRRQAMAQASVMRVGLSEARQLIQLNHKGAQYVLVPHCAAGPRMVTSCVICRTLVMNQFHLASLAAKPKPPVFAMWRYFSPTAMHHLVDAVRAGMTVKLVPPEGAAHTSGRGAVLVSHCCASSRRRHQRHHRPIHLGGLGPPCAWPRGGRPRTSPAPSSAAD